MHRDFKELLSAFNEGHVKYLVVGGYAVSMHAEPRATKDLDILVGADAENGKAVYAALAKFGAPVEGLTAKDFTDLDSLFRMGTPQNDQPQSPSGGSRAFETMQQAQERGVEEWLKLRQKQLVDGRMPTLEDIQAKGREDWIRYRERQNEKSRRPDENIDAKDRPLDSDREDSAKNNIKEIDDDFGL